MKNGLVLNGRFVNFTCSREYPDLNCLYDAINPGIEKITAPNRYQYQAATRADGKKYLSIKARKNPTPALKLYVD